MDLDLIPMEDLIDEIKKRTRCYALAYISHQDGRKDDVVFNRWSNNNYVEEVGIANILVNDIVNSSKEAE